MKTKINSLSWLTCGAGLVTVAGLLLTTGCGNNSDGVEDVTVTTAAMLGESSDNSDEADLGRMRGMGLGLIDGLPGIAAKCDSEPSVTSVVVCGSELPATESYAWTDCRMSMGKGRGGSGPTSSGSVEVRHAISGATDACAPDQALEFSDTTTIDIARIMPNGRQMTLRGDVIATSAHPIGALEFVKNVSIALNRQITDSNGGQLRSIELSGTASIAFSLDAVGPLRTFDGALTANDADNGVQTLTLTGVARRDADICRWPVAGSIARAASDGTQHTLVFSSTCGSAELDGVPVDLNARRGNGGHGKSGGKHGSGDCSM